MLIIIIPSVLVGVGLFLWAVISYSAKRHHVSFWEQVFSEK